MAANRKDRYGYVLHQGECHRKDGRYCYTYVDYKGKRHYIYAKTLKSLRAKEEKIIVDKALGIDSLEAQRMTLNRLYDRFMSQKIGLKPSTRHNYIYMYNQFVRETFGKKYVCNIKYYDIKKFYLELLSEKRLKVNTLEIVHNQIFPALQMGVRDGLIRNNPALGIMGEIKRSKLWITEPRHALTIPQQKKFMEYTKSSNLYRGWVPLFTVLLGTGMRIGECLGLTWPDINFDEGYIEIKRSLSYRVESSGKTEFHIYLPKTRAGERMIPLFNEVREALLEEFQMQRCLGFSSAKVDGVGGFVFVTGNGKPVRHSAVNRVIHRIVKMYNEEETLLASKERREAILLPDFSCHTFRHTFCTRLCENESNTKIIQSIMGHSDISTTMDIYAEATMDKKKEIANNLEGKITIT